MTTQAYRTFDSLHVMSYIIKRCQFLNVPDLNTTKLQKLMYCCYGTVLTKFGFPISGEQPEAWQYGPVFPKTLRMLQKIPFEEFARLIDSSDVDLGLEDEHKKMIDTTLQFFGRYKASWLSAWSHSVGSPWARASNDGEDLYGQIDDLTIVSYFKQHIFKPSAKLSELASSPRVASL